MEKVITLRAKAIQIMFDEHAVHITNNQDLAQLLNQDLETVTDELVKRIMDIFQQEYSRKLDISDASLAVEIWGHVYCGHLAKVLDELVQLKLVEKIMDKVISYCEVIDCGEPGHDSNRLFWDMLAPFKSTIAAILAKATLV